MPFNTQQPIDTKTLDSIVQLGAIGVLLLLALALVIFLWTKRNAKPSNAVESDAIVALARIADNQQEQIKEQQAWQRKAEEANRALVSQINERNIESVSAVADATNRLADTLQSQTALLTAINSGNQAQSASVLTMQADLKQMTEVGSKPLQGLVEMVARIEITLNQIKAELLPCTDIKDIREKDRLMYQGVLEAVKTDIELFRASIMGYIEEKRRDTGEMKSVMQEEGGLT